VEDIAKQVKHFAPRFGWANRILRIDLCSRSIDVEPVEPYVPQFLGGRGIAARLAWNECPEPIGPYAPDNPLVIMAGALTGTRSPYSGRTSICSFSPQAHPYNWFTRSNFGAQWGAELKKAGYDGIVVTGVSDTPVQIVIHDDEVCISGADDLWGLDTFETMEALRKSLHRRIKSLVIGPAGERLSRIATIQAATSSAAGQGGFGAVMGAKRLKAISVLGSGKVRVAHPERFEALIRALNRELRVLRRKPDVHALNQRLEVGGGGRVRPYACTASCPTPCNIYYRGMPGAAYPDRMWEGHMACVGSCFRGRNDDGPIHHGGLFDWKLGLHGGFEMNGLSNRYGLNQWDIILGIVPWLERCQQEGLISEVNGRAIDWQDPSFWAMFLHAIAYREGLGDVFAEGGLRAASLLGMGEDIVRRHYTGWGYGGHWDGHADLLNHFFYPYWIVSALQWATDTRDPYSSSHGYVQGVMNWAPYPHKRRAEADLTWEHMLAIGERVYGSALAVAPEGGYGHKAYPAFYHDKRSVMKDCVPTDDQVFPLIHSTTTEDRFFRVGDIEGPSVDYHLFTLGTGAEMSEEDFERAAERIYTQERALCVRHWARDRSMDECVLPAFEYEENWENPILGEKHALDRGRFGPVLDDYYRLMGWDKETGWPTRERLAQLGLGDVYEVMVAGSSSAAKVRPEWPEPTRTEVRTTREPAER
jgi:aldehyde:ferredoxin oxidoreductase